MLAPWKKSHDQPRQHIKKQRHYFADKGPSTQSYGFSSSHVWIWELDHKAEGQRIDGFELWYWRRLLRVPWTARRSNKSILKEISLEYSWKDWCWSWKSNTLATCCEEPTHWRRPWCWERLKVGGEGGKRRWDGWMASPTQRTWVWAGSRSCWWTGKASHAALHGVTELDMISNWAELILFWCSRYCFSFVLSSSQQAWFLKLHFS